jgi:hypothetical protein
MKEGLLLSARSVSSLLAHIFGPSFYDDPRFGRGDPGPGRRIDRVGGPLPDPWVEVALNPQPLPPKERHALAIADAHLQDILQLDRIGGLFGGEAAERAEKRALGFVAELDELCPRWPRWPKHWPPPPPPPWGEEEMNPAALFLYGTRFLAAAEGVESERLQSALAQLGEKALGASLRG